MKIIATFLFSSILLIANEKFSLTINAEPQANISIMNIKPKYFEGIELEKGSYDILIKSPDCKSFRDWIDLNETKTLNFKCLNGKYQKVEIKESSDLETSSEDSGMFDEYTELAKKKYEETDLQETLWDILNPTFSASYLFQLWIPTEIEGTEYDTTPLSLFRFKGSLADKIFLLYETNFGGAPLEKQKELIKKREEYEATKSQFDKFIGRLKYNKFFFEYTTELFISTITVQSPKYYIDGDKIGILRNGDKIDTETVFERYRLGLMNDATIDEKYGSMGLFYQTYQKPYSYTFNDYQDDSSIYNAELYSLGLFIGFGDYLNGIIDQRDGGAHIEVDFYLGYGEIVLSDSDEFGYDFSDTLDEDSVGFMEIDARYQLNFKSFYDFNFFLSAQGVWKRYFLLDYDEYENKITFDFGQEFNNDYILNFTVGLAY